MNTKTGENQTEEDIYDEGEFEDDGTADIIRKAIEAMDDDEEDTAGFDQPPVDRQSDLPDVVSPDEGHDLLDKAREAKQEDNDAGKIETDPEKIKSDADQIKKDDADDDDSASNDDDKAASGDKAKSEDSDTSDDTKVEDKTVDLTNSSVDALLDGMPDDKRTEVSRRLQDAADVLAPLQTEYAKSELEMHGATPKDAVARLVELNSFAQKVPGEYLAWVSEQVAGEKAADVMSEAAELLGYKLVKADADNDGKGDDDDEIFLDDGTKAKLAELKKYKEAEKNNGSAFGPDTPQRQQNKSAAKILNDFKGAQDDNGNLLRPDFDYLAPQIGQIAAAMVKENGRNLSAADLETAYDRARAEARKALGVETDAAPNDPKPQDSGSEVISAAQRETEMSQELQNKAAAAAEKAKKASKSVDGSGQGASRRPALPDDASVEDTIRHFAGQES
ncbi:MAG: hypothetical protein AAGD43_04700 [Pseudomonadota bacterium]